MQPVAQQRLSGRAEPRGYGARWDATTREILGLLVVVALCLVLRIVNLGALPIFLDEADSAQSAVILGASPDLATWLVPIAHGVYPLFSWLAAPFTRAISDPLLATRYASAVVGTVGIIPVWAVGRALRGSVAGLLAALLYALCPFTLFHNRLVLTDGLVATCGAGALFFSIQVSRSGRSRDAIALGLCLAAGTLTKIFALSMLLLPLMAAMTTLPLLRPIVRRGALSAAVLCVLPLPIMLLLGDTSRHLNDVQTRFVGIGLVPRVIANQCGTLIAALWLHVTPVMLVLAIGGLWSLRHERVGVLVGVWAVMGGLIRVLTPVSYITPRHLVYVAVPIVVLAACGLVVLIDNVTRRINNVPSIVFAAICTSVVVAPSIVTDVTIITAPARTPLVAFDRWQYVTGWPSGYAVTRVVSYLHQQEARGRVNVLIPPGYLVTGPLTVLLSGDQRITLTTVSPQQLSEHLPEAIGGKTIFVLMYRPSYVPLTLDHKRVRLVLHAATSDNDGACDLYRIVG